MTGWTWYQETCFTHLYLEGDPYTARRIAKKIAERFETRAVKNRFNIFVRFLIKQENVRVLGFLKEMYIETGLSYMHFLEMSQADDSDSVLEELASVNPEVVDISQVMMMGNIPLFRKFLKVFKSSYNLEDLRFYAASLKDSQALLSCFEEVRGLWKKKPDTITWCISKSMTPLVQSAALKKIPTGEEEDNQETPMNSPPTTPRPDEFTKLIMVLF